MKLTKGETTTAGSLPHEEVITMTPTKKILEAFDEKFPNLGASNIEDGWYDAKPEVKSFLTSSIAQALAEDRVRVVGEIERLATCGDCAGTGIKDCDKCERDSHKCSLCFQTGEIHIYKDDLLASLQYKPLTDK